MALIIAHRQPPQQSPTLDAFDILVDSAHRVATLAAAHDDRLLASVTAVLLTAAEVVHAQAEREVQP